MSFPALANEELDCLAKNIYFEARGEPESGQYAVALVTMNRVKDTSYPNSVCEVISQPYQFSWYSESRAASFPANTEAGVKALIIASDVISGVVYDFTEGALFFHGKQIQPYWTKKLEKTLEIGTHIFYRRF